MLQVVCKFEVQYPRFLVPGYAPLANPYVPFQEIRRVRLGSPPAFLKKQFGLVSRLLAKSEELENLFLCPVPLLVEGDCEVKIAVAFAQNGVEQLCVGRLECLMADQAVQ